MDGGRGWRIATGCKIIVKIRNDVETATGNLFNWPQQKLNFRGFFFAQLVGKGGLLLVNLLNMFFLFFHLRRLS